RAVVAVPVIQEHHDVAMEAEDREDDERQEVESKDSEFNGAHDVRIRSSSPSQFGGARPESAPSPVRVSLCRFGTEPIVVVSVQAAELVNRPRYFWLRP